MKRGLLKWFSVLMALILVSAMLLPAMAEGDKPEKLTILMWGGVEDQTKYDAAIAKYWPYPDIAVETILVPNADFAQKMLTMIATDSAPDVFWVNDSWFFKWYNDGYMVPLGDLMEDAEYNYADFAPKQAQTYQVDGIAYSIPFSSPPEVLFYNKTLLEKAGLETPNDLYAKGEWTTDKMYEYALKLADPDNGIYGVNYTRAGNWTGWNTFLVPVIRAYGGEFWSADFSTVLINSEEAIKGLQMWSDLMFVYKAHPQPGDTADFFAGKCALYPSFVGDMRKCGNLDFEWDIAPMPFAPDGSYAAYLGSASVAVYAGGAYVDYAKELLKTVTGSGVIGELMDLFISPRASVLNSEEFVTGHHGEMPRPTAEHFQQAVSDHTAYIRTPPLHPNVDSIEDVIMAHMESFFMQMETAEECLNGIAEEIEEYMIK